MSVYTMHGHDRLHLDDEYTVTEDRLGVSSVVRKMGNPAAYASLRCAELRMRTS